MIVGDTQEAAGSLAGSLGRFVSVTADVHDHNMRFAPQWTAPEMLRTPLGLSPLPSVVECTLYHVPHRNIQFVLGHL